MMGNRRIGWLTLLLVLALGYPSAEAAQELRVSLLPMVRQPRMDSPIWVAVDFDSRSKRLMAGRLEIEFR